MKTLSSKLRDTQQCAEVCKLRPFPRKNGEVVVCTVRRKAPLPRLWRKKCTACAVRMWRSKARSRVTPLCAMRCCLAISRSARHAPAPKEEESGSPFMRSSNVCFNPSPKSNYAHDVFSRGSDGGHDAPFLEGTDAS